MLGYGASPYDARVHLSVFVFSRRDLKLFFIFPFSLILDSRFIHHTRLYKDFFFQTFFALCYD